MTERMIDISDQPAKLNIDTGRLVITTGEGKVFVPIADIAALVVSHRQVTFTQAVLREISLAGGVFVICDEYHLPCGMLLPLQTHHAQTLNFNQQAEIKQPIKKKLWQEIVRAKIKNQASVLKQLTGDDAGLSNIISQVRSGDPTNREALAAKIYWRALFGQAFRRDVNRLDKNRHLNYGYAIIRGIIARGLCAAGLHPSLGIHHHNRNNAFCLADDIMEPFRPIVDMAVYEWLKNSTDTDFDKEAKNNLLESISGRYNCKGEQRTLFDISSRTAVVLAAVFRGEKGKLEIAKLLRI